MARPHAQTLGLGGIERLEEPLKVPAGPDPGGNVLPATFPGDRRQRIDDASVKPGELRMRASSGIRVMIVPPG